MAKLHWKARDPFKIGQTVYAREADKLESFGLFLTAGKAYRIAMLGEDRYGPWAMIEGVVECLPVRLFRIDPPPVMQPVSEDVEAL
jgi:hypothetical protein